MTAFEPDRVEKFLLFLAHKKPDGFAPWSIASGTGIALREIISALNSLAEHGFLKVSEESATLTPRGRAWLMANQAAFLHSGALTWREVPKEFKGNKIAAFQLYVPSIKRLDRKFFAIGKAKDAS
ncbi:MAG TPA: hypothetical protein VGN68_12995 [Sphingopyxis sp.]|jgi:hypothetical protein|uniref:hypothetical protein n=1 Tax=Sphingopyxis sp. TaxID=1908224 RepID=UPI002E144263|nr:hypothetical protein [Sphingopyxis sp.]